MGSHLISARMLEFVYYTLTCITEFTDGIVPRGVCVC